MNVAFIPARGGSKSIPLKNIKPFCGKPLIYWVLKALNEASKIDRVIVATDHGAIIETVKSFNFSKCEIYLRSKENAQDHSSTESVMLEYLHNQPLMPDDLFVLVQLTTPFLTKKMIEEAFEVRATGAYDSILSVIRSKRFFWNPDGQPINYDYQNRPRRQDFDGIFMENGSFYINSVQNIQKDKNRLSGKIGLYEMPEYTGVELDEEDDWPLAEQLFHKHHVVKAEEHKKIKLVLTDVDGVLTDAGMYYSENGEELKKFNTRDGMGFELLRKHGIKTGIITSENTKLVERRAKKLKADYLFQGKRDGGKLAAALEICKQENIELSEVAYIGDDLNCKELLEQVGLAACPSDAMVPIKRIINIKILSTPSGEGAFRELVSILLSKK